MENQFPVCTEIVSRCVNTGHADGMKVSEFCLKYNIGLVEGILKLTSS